MPSLVTARKDLTGRSFSRVNSFKREWADEQESQQQSQQQLQQNHPSSSATTREIDWSPSPERVSRKNLMAATSRYTVAPTTGGQQTGETAADRRRRAILEAMAPNTSTEASSSSSTIQYRPQPVPARQQVLPTLPENHSTLREGKNSEHGSLSKLKRGLPWEEDFTTAKKVLTAGTRSRTTSSSSSDKKGKPLASINIRQIVTLSTEQQKVLKLVVQEGRNIFFTGSAGTGKSVLLREIIKNLRRKYAIAADAVAVTASTGIAACNIGGVTLHSFGGCGLALETAEQLVSKIKKNKKAAARWTRTKVLIIDEVSMVDGDMFDKFNKIGQMMRKRPGVPFGGIQIIVTGDFFQLPPVTKGGASPKFCFEAQTWNEAIHMSVNLTKVFRQKDQRFVDMLNEMRFGKLTPLSISSFQQLARHISYDDGIAATELFPRREDVDRANNQRLAALNTDGWSYVSTDGGAIQDHAQREKMLANFMAPQQIMLKVDAQVMLIKNVDETLANGSMGKVIGFCHKIEYLTDSAGQWRQSGPDDDEAFEVEEDNDKRQKTREYLKSKIAPGSKPLPVVQFKIPGGGYRDMLVEYDVFKSELPNGEVQVSRSQLPLILAWAMSIHKSQGQTLDRVKVDLGKVFEKGQAYVALSRATSLDGLEVTGFKADKVMAHRKVAVWSESLQDLNV